MWSIAVSLPNALAHFRLIEMFILKIFIRIWVFWWWWRWWSHVHSPHILGRWFYKAWAFIPSFLWQMRTATLLAVIVISSLILLTMF